MSPQSVFPLTEQVRAEIEGQRLFSHSDRPPHVGVHSPGRDGRFYNDHSQAELIIRQLKEAYAPADRCVSSALEAAGSFTPDSG